MRRGWLIVFAKAPAAGRVKTRLSPPFTPSEAAELYRCLLADVLDVSVAVARSLDLEAVLCVDPPAEAASIAAAAPDGLRVIAQAPGSLGKRMGCAAQQAFAAGAPFALLRGSDSPCLGEKMFREAIGALLHADVAICPDRDGGYSLVGLGDRTRCSLVALFDHPMSTPRVLHDTLANADRLGLRSGLLAPSFDLDRFDDLRLLATERHGNASALCPRTLQFLDEHGLWPALARPPAPA